MNLNCIFIKMNFIEFQDCEYFSSIANIYYTLTIIKLIKNLNLRIIFPKYVTIEKIKKTKIPIILRS